MTVRRGIRRNIYVVLDPADGTDYGSYCGANTCTSTSSYGTNHKFYPEGPHNLYWPENRLGIYLGGLSMTPLDQNGRQSIECSPVCYEYVQKAFPSLNASPF